MNGSDTARQGFIETDEFKDKLSIKIESPEDLRGGLKL
jgi:hypothetical protein